MSTLRARAALMALERLGVGQYPERNDAWPDRRLGQRTERLVGVWGSGPNDVWAVEIGGAILHGDGSTWTKHADVGIPLHAVWGTSSSDVWAVGRTLVHWNGTTWSTTAGFDELDLAAISGSGPNDVWVVGEAGTILRGP